MSEGDEGPLNVSLSGPMTLYESSEIRETLLGALRQRRKLRVDLEMSGPWHIAGLQLLIAAVLQGREQGTEVRLAHVPGVCSSVAARAGLSDWLTEVSDSFL